MVWLHASSQQEVIKRLLFLQAYGGLRGAITFSLVFMLDPELLTGKQEKKNLLLTATYIIIFFTTFLQVGAAMWVLDFWTPERGHTARLSIFLHSCQPQKGLGIRNTPSGIRR